MPAADFEDRARRVQVHRHAEVEILLRPGADHGGEVEDAVGAGRQRALQRRPVGNVAGNDDDARVGGEVGRRRGGVEQDQPLDPRFRPVAPGERVGGEQAARQPGAEEARRPRDRNVHRPAPRIQPSPSTVPPFGRYSHPTQPS